MPAMPPSERDGFTVDVQALDRLPPIFAEVGSTLRTGRQLGSTSAGASACGSEQLASALTNFGSIMSTFMNQAVIRSECDLDKVVAIRERFQNTEESNAARMVNAYVRTLGTQSSALRPTTLESILQHPPRTPGPSVSALPSTSGRRPDSVRELRGPK
jgi:hypothetical protein